MHTKELSVFKKYYLANINKRLSSNEKFDIIILLFVYNINILEIYHNFF